MQQRVGRKDARSSPYSPNASPRRTPHDERPCDPDFDRKPDPVQFKNGLDTISLKPGVWGDYTEAAATITDLFILTGLERPADTDDIAFIRFIALGGNDAGVVFEEAAISDFWVVTVVKPPGYDWWRVWGLFHNHFPSASEMKG